MATMRMEIPLVPIVIILASHALMKVDVIHVVALCIGNLIMILVFARARLATTMMA